MPAPNFPERPSEIAAAFAANPGAADLHEARAAQLTRGLKSMRSCPALKKRAAFTATNHRRIAKGQAPREAVPGRNGFCVRGAAYHNETFAAFAEAVRA